MHLPRVVWGGFDSESPHLVAWGQAANSHLNEVLILQKPVLCLMYFSDCTSDSAPRFACSGILPIKMFYFKVVTSLLHDISRKSLCSTQCL